MAHVSDPGQNPLPPDEVEWMLDGGSQWNVASDLMLFARLDESSDGPQLLFGNDSTETATIRGSVLMHVVNKHSNMPEDRFLDDVVYSPNAPANIISQGYMQLRGGFHLSTSLDHHTAWLTKSSLRLEFKMRDGIYYMRVPRQPKLVMSVMTQPAVICTRPMHLLHNRMGHIGIETLRKLVAQHVDLGVNLNERTIRACECIPCSEAKMRQMTYRRNPRRRTTPLEKLSMDVCSIGDATVSGETMFLLVVDEATRFKWGYLLKSKGEAARLVKALVKRLQLKFKSWPILILHGDQGGEFLGGDLAEFCAQEGIEAQFTNGYSPQENSIVERANGVVVTRLRTLLRATMLPNLLWGEAFHHSIYTLNRTPTTVLDFKSPYEMLHDRPADLSLLRTWGCIAQMRVPPESRPRKEKLASRTEMCLLLGYGVDTKGYKMMNLCTGGIRTCRLENALFHEEFTCESSYVKKLLKNVFLYGDYELPTHLPVVHMKSSMESYAVDVEQAQPPMGVSAEPAKVTPKRSDAALPSVSGRIVDNAVPGTGDGAEDIATAVPNKRKRKPGLMPYRDDTADSVVRDDDAVPQPASPTTLPARRRRRANVRLRDYVVNNVLTHGVDIDIPANDKEARASPQWPQWRDAMHEELHSLIGRHTWDLVRRAEVNGAKVITCRWVCALKRDEHGNIKRYKARLVIHGFKQEFGVNFHETYAPVVRFESIRAAIYFAMTHGWDILQYDVKTAFLYGELAELVFMEQPPGIDGTNPEMVCRLLKSLYGLRQAPRIWNETLDALLRQINFVRLDSDYGLYALKAEDGSILMLLTVYVDDLLLMGPTARCARVAAQLKEQFELASLDLFDICLASRYWWIVLECVLFSFSASTYLMYFGDSAWKMLWTRLLHRQQRP